MDAAERFASTSLPTDALEEWRYSRIGELDLARYRPVLQPLAGAGAGELPRPARDFVSVAGVGATVVVVRDGATLTYGGTDPAVTVEDLSDPGAAPVDLGGIAGMPDAFAAANSAMAAVPVRVRIARGATAPVFVVHAVETAGTAIFPRLKVDVDEAAAAQVVEVVCGPAGALVVPVTELDVAAGAQLGYTHVQLLGTEAWQLGLQASRVGRDATLTSAAVALGGDYARLRTDSLLDGTGATSRLLAVYFATGAQSHDFRTVQHHRAPRTTSQLLYKGVVANRSRSVYSGLIRVEKGARGTNAFQTNRNLVLHEGAHADSVPNLEIEDNDVRCSHASAVGPIAEDQRFYLESRGVPPEVGDRLIALGFVDEVLEHLPLPGMAAPVRALLSAKLDEAEATEAGAAGAVRVGASR